MLVNLINLTVVGTSGFWGHTVFGTSHTRFALFMILIFITLLGPLAVGYILISYIKSLEQKNCACSNDRRRKYVKFL